MAKALRAHVELRPTSRTYEVASTSWYEAPLAQQDRGAWYASPEGCLVLV